MALSGGLWGGGVWGAALWGVSGLTVAGGAETAQALADSGAQVAHLVEIEVGTGDPVAVETLGWPAMWGSSLWGSSGTIGTLPFSTATLRFSDLGWIGETVDLDKPNVFYAPRLALPGRFDRSFPVRPWAASAAIASYGRLLLFNGDGGLNGLADTPAEGRRVRLLTGQARVQSALVSAINEGQPWARYANFGEVFVARGGAWSIGQISAELGLTSWAPRLEGPANPTRYAGTGGAEGGAELAGLPKPLCYGSNFNVTPVSVATASVEYQVHDGAVRGIDAVRVQGVAQVDAGDYADRASLIAAQPGLSVGEFATCEAEGRFVLASAPSGQVTADVRGDATPSYVSSAALILGRFLAGRQGIDAYSGTGFAQLNAGTAGIYVGAEERTALQVVTELVTGCGGALGETRSGALTAFVLHDPATYPVGLVVRRRDILRVEPLALPAPPATIEVSYRRNFTLQAGGDLAGSVGAADRDDYGRRWRVVSAATGAGSLNAAATQRVRLDSPLADWANAQTVANWLAGLHVNGRRLWRVQLSRAALDVALGQVVRLTHPQIGTDARLQVVGVGLALDLGTVDLTLWG